MIKTSEHLHTHEVRFGFTIKGDYCFTTPKEKLHEVLSLQLLFDNSEIAFQLYKGILAKRTRGDAVISTSLRILKIQEFLYNI